MNKLLKWWMTPKFPEIHLSDDVNFVKKWIFHPIKRRLARTYLKFLQKYTDIKVIGITGSAGKTTTKEMLASILALKAKTAYSVANIDPIYNIPTTILRTPFGTKYLILEMGVEYPNEMDFYLWMAKPNIGVITNIFATHTKYFGDVNGVLKEKGKLVLGLNSSDIAILTQGDKHLKLISKKIHAKIVWVRKAADIFTQNGYVASYTASELGLKVNDITKGLKLFKKPPHRMNMFSLKSGAVVFDDSYNSNPSAFLSSLKMFLKISGKANKVAVVGDMLELGENEIEFHKEIGRELSKNNFQAVIGVGVLSKYVVDEIKIKNTYTKTYLVSKSDDVYLVLQEYLIEGVYIFIKGSRSIGLDRLVDKLV